MAAKTAKAKKSSARAVAKKPVVKAKSAAVSAKKRPKVMTAQSQMAELLTFLFAILSLLFLAMAYYAYS